MAAEANAVSETKTSYLDWAREGRAGIARYLITAVVMVVVFFVVAGLLSALPVVFLQIAAPDFDHSDLGRNVKLFLPFLFAFVLIPFVVRAAHGRPGWSVALPTRHIPFGDLLTGFGVALAVSIVLSVVLHVTGLYELDYVGIDWSRWLLVAAVTAPLILIQASAEEMLFRGYLTQLVRSLTDRPVLFVSIPAMLFSIPHIRNIDEFGGSITALFPYFLSGLLYGWAAWRSGSLLLGAGLHWANNLGGELLFGVEGDVIETVAPWIGDIPSLAVVTALTALNAVLTVAVLEILMRRQAGRP